MSDYLDDFDFSCCPMLDHASAMSTTGYAYALARWQLLKISAKKLYQW